VQGVLRVSLYRLIVHPVKLSVYRDSSWAALLTWSLSSSLELQPAEWLQLTPDDIPDQAKAVETVRRLFSNWVTITQGVAGLGINTALARQTRVPEWIVHPYTVPTKKRQAPRRIEQNNQSVTDSVFGPQSSAGKHQAAIIEARAS